MTNLESLKIFVRSNFPAVAKHLEKTHLPHDRYILEKKIFPYFVAQQEFYKILFVGCESYTQHYDQFFTNKEYWTLEIDPTKRHYGADKHIISPLRSIDQHFSENSLDLILCNGVFLVGAMDERSESEESFTRCFQCLRSGGILMVGWNDTPEFRPYPIAQSQALKLFTPYLFPPLSTAQYLSRTTHKHTFNFYIKP
jgi:hypothetical protein